MENLLSFRIHSVYHAMISRIQTYLNIFAESIIYVENGKLSYKKAVRDYQANKNIVLYYIKVLKQLIEKYNLPADEIECINGYISWYENIKYYFESKEVKL